jgi:hypothetical protein
MTPSDSSACRPSVQSERRIFTGIELALQGSMVIVSPSARMVDASNQMRADRQQRCP